MTDTDYVNRFSKASSLALENENFSIISSIDKKVYRSKLENKNKNFEDYRVGYGFFTEIENISYEELASKITDKYQTITYFGIDAQKIAKQFISSGVRGVDRIVPIGNALDLGLVWDGYDIIRSLSRVIAVR